MSKFSDWLRSGVSRSPAEFRRRGLARWFQVMEERFMSMFWSGLLAMACMAPACICLTLFIAARDWLSLLGAILFFALGSPSLVSLFFICMQAVRDKPAWVWDSFKKAYAQESKKAIPLSVLLGLLWLGFLLAVGLVLSGTAASLPTLILLLAAGLMLSGFTFFTFQQMATVELPLHNILRNGILLVFAGKSRSFAVCVLTLAAVLLSAWFYYVSYFVMMIGMLAVLVMTGELIFCPVFEMLFLEQAEE